MLAMGNNTGIEVPAEVLEALGGGKRPAVNVTVNGFEYRTTARVMAGKSLLPFSSDKRAATGIKGGDHLVVELTLDTAPRTVSVPEDLGAALDAAGCAQVRHGLTESAQGPRHERRVGEGRRDEGGRSRPSSPKLCASTGLMFRRRGASRRANLPFRQSARARTIGVVVSIASRSGRRITRQ